jgi:CDP-diacylglycerol--glycerol-3-phosphate 3-phosphatidyltransferase
LDEKEKTMNVPDMFIYYRLFAVPIFFGLYTTGDTLTAGIIFVSAAISDFFDGFFARRMGIDNDFGKLMDPLADKFITLTAFICFASSGIIPSWVVVVIACREMLVTSLRALAATKGKVIAAGWSGKWKTGLQMAAIIVICFSGWPFSLLGWTGAGLVLAYAAAGLTVVSGIEYCYRNRQFFEHSKK